VETGVVRVYPTATQSDALAHDTDISSSFVPAALGLDTTDHAEPFQDITNSLDPAFPAATHSVALTQVTEFRALPLCPELGLDTTDHADPSQDITNV
jgi:hypothetical protein